MRRGTDDGDGDVADLQMAQTPFQEGEVAPAIDPQSLDPERNRRALKTLLHHLGADIAGTCEAKPMPVGAKVSANCASVTERPLARARSKHM